jgi:hypothetical protein
MRSKAMSNAESSSSSHGHQFTKDIIELHRAVHRQLREEISALDSEALNWAPGLDTSSIGTIVTHVLGAEAEMLRNVLHIPTNRNRDAEFAPQMHKRDHLLRLIDAADQDWEELAPRIDEDALSALMPRPNKPDPQSGLFWLVRNYGHIREHLAQVQLTKQLYENRLEHGSE